MSRLLTLLTVVVVLAALRAAVTVLAIVLVAMLLFYTVTRPRQTLMFLANVVLLGLASTHPVAFIIGVCIIGATVAAVAAWHKRRPAADGTSGRHDHHAKASDRDLIGQPPEHLGE